MIRIKNLKKSYGRVEVLKGVYLSTDPGTISAILGPNGSGKTTLLKSTLGLVIPDDGSIEYKGKSILNKSDYRKEVGYLPQVARFPDNLKIKELIRMIEELKGLPADSEHLIDLFNLSPFLSKPLKDLSGGTRQKVNLVLTFMFDNHLIILDEPSAGLDPVSLLKLKKLLLEFKAKGKTILFTSHILPFVQEMADELIFLLEGKVFYDGTPSELLNITGATSIEEAIADILSTKIMETTATFQK